MDSSYLKQLKNQSVRDLYWLLFEPSPLQFTPGEFELPLLPEPIIKSWLKDSTTYFDRLDRSPETLDRFVDRPKNKRLGFYCEALMSFFLQTFPGITLWLQNFQIIEDKNTRGEVDFIFSWKEHVIHIELAVKYYLLLPDSSAYSGVNWIGPSRKDNLHKKLTKVQNSQLQLGKHATILKRLPHSIGNNINSYLMLKGHFFGRPNTQHDYQFLNKPLGNYYFEKEINNQVVNFLYRPNWLSSFYNEVDSSTSTIVTSITKPAMFKGKDGKNGFVVPNNWND